MDLHFSCDSHEFLVIEQSQGIPLRFPGSQLLIFFPHLLGPLLQVSNHPKLVLLLMNCFLCCLVFRLSTWTRRRCSRRWLAMSSKRFSLDGLTVSWKTSIMKVSVSRAMLKGMTVSWKSSITSLSVTRAMLEDMLVSFRMFDECGEGSLGVSRRRLSNIFACVKVWNFPLYILIQGTGSVSVFREVQKLMGVTRIVKLSGNMYQNSPEVYSNKVPIEKTSLNVFMKEIVNGNGM